MAKRTALNLSNLPTEVLSHIISFLPSESAVQTRLLSKRWNDVWNATLVLHGPSETMAGALTGFLDNVDWRCPLQNPWKLQFNSDDGTVLHVTTGAKGKLHLDFFSRRMENEQPRFCLVTRRSDQAAISFPPTPVLFCVRFLYLTSISYLNADVISSVLYHLHFLECVDIRYCAGLGRLSFNHDSKIKKVSIVSCPRLDCLALLLDELLSLRIRGNFPRTMSLVSKCSFEDIMLDCREGPAGGEECDRFVLPPVLQAKHLTLCGWIFQVISSARKNSLSWPFAHLKELWWIDNSMERDNLDCLILFITRCCLLQRLYITIDPACYSPPRRKDRSSYHELHSEASLGASTCYRSSKIGLSHLKLVKLDGFKHQKDEKLVANSLMELISSDALIVSTSNGSCPRRLVTGHPWEYSNTFVEGVDDAVLNYKHMHMDF